MNRSFTLLNHTKAFHIKDFLNEFLLLDGLHFLCLYFTYFLQLDTEYFKPIIAEQVTKCVINILDFVIMIIEQISLRNYLEQIESFFYYFSAFLEKVYKYLTKFTSHFKINEDFFDCLMKYITFFDMNIELYNYENLRNKLLHLFLNRNFFRSHDYHILVILYKNRTHSFRFSVLVSRLTEKACLIKFFSREFLALPRNYMT
jgi:hypothetical protein